MGRSPKFNRTKERRCAGGKIVVSSYADKGEITDNAFHGDFYGNKDIEVLRSALIGVRYNVDEVRQRLEEVDAGDYFF